MDKELAMDLYSHKFYQKKRQFQNSNPDRKFALRVVFAGIVSSGVIFCFGGLRFSSSQALLSHYTSIQRELNTFLRGPLPHHGTNAIGQGTAAIDSMANGGTVEQAKSPFFSSESLDWTTMSDEDLLRHLIKIAKAGNPVQKDQVSGNEFYFQLPQIKSPSAIIFLAHESGYKVHDWFPSLTLRSPESQAIRQLALDRGMMVVALPEGPSGCWAPTDAPRIAQVLQHVHSRIQKLATTSSNSRMKLLAFGSSAGANVLASHLPQAFEASMGDNGEPIPLDGIIVENVGSKLNPGIKTVFIVQENEKPFKREIEQVLEENKGSQDDLARYVWASQQRITPTFLSKRISFVSEKESLILHQLLLNHGMVGPDYCLKKDPTHDYKMFWVYDDAFQMLGIEGGDEFISAVNEALLATQGRLELTRDGVAEALDVLGQW